VCSTARRHRVDDRALWSHRAHWTGRARNRQPLKRSQAEARAPKPARDRARDAKAASQMTGESARAAARRRRSGPETAPR
jgi:hypothetical protein